MERYIGLDAHASSCTLGVMTPSGKRIGSHVVERNARYLIEAGVGNSKALSGAEARYVGFWVGQAAAQWVFSVDSEMSA